MSKLLEDLEKLASAEFVDLSVADAARDTIIRQQTEIAALRAQLGGQAMSDDIVKLARQHRHVAQTHYEGCEADHIGCLVHRLADEVERLRAMLPPTAHSGVRNGPGEGSWSVFAEKVVEERDAARAKVEKQRAEIEALHAALKHRDAERLIERMSPSEKMAILDRLEAQERRRRAALDGKP